MEERPAPVSRWMKIETTVWVEIDDPVALRDGARAKVQATKFSESWMLTDTLLEIEGDFTHVVLEICDTALWLDGIVGIKETSATTAVCYTNEEGKEIDETTGELLYPD
jgi:hypothetical protein